MCHTQGKGGHKAMREIDDRYPEYARPYEPLRRGRRYGKLTGNEATLFARRSMHKEVLRKHYALGASMLIVLAVLFSMVLPSSGNRSSAPDPTPIVTLAPTPVPTPVLTPIPTPI